MNTLFPTESPTRALHRINLIEEEEQGLLTLPSMESVSDLDFTIDEESPVRPTQSLLTLQPTTPSPSLPTNNNNKHDRIYSTSTPAPISSTAVSMLDSLPSSTPLGSSTSLQQHTQLNDGSKFYKPSLHHQQQQYSIQVEEVRSMEKAKETSARHMQVGSGSYDSSQTPSTSISSSERAGFSLRSEAPVRVDVNAAEGKTTDTATSTHHDDASLMPFSQTHLRKPNLNDSSTHDDYDGSITSPFRERNGVSMLSSPGVGRHASPLPASLLSNQSVEATMQHSLSIQPSISRIYEDDDSSAIDIDFEVDVDDQRRGGIVLLKGQGGATSAAQKRMVNLLAVVRSSSMPQELRGLSRLHSLKSPSLQQGMELSRDSEEGEAFSSDSTTDLGKDRLAGKFGSTKAADSSNDTVGILEKVLDLQRLIVDKDVKIVELRELVIQARDMTVNSEDHLQHVHKLQREVFELEDRLEFARVESETKQDALDQLQARSMEASDGMTSQYIALQKRSKELVAELDERDGELVAANDQLEEQEKEFADKMQKLEVEMCRVLEDQEDQLEEARLDLETNKREETRRRTVDSSKLSELRIALDALEAEMVDVKRARDILERSRVVEDDAGSMVEGSSDDVDELRRLIDDLERTNASKDVQLSQSSDRVNTLRHQHSRSLDALTAKIHLLEGTISSSGMELQVQIGKLQQSDEACEELEQLNQHHNSTIDSLRLALTHEKATITSLSTQLAQLAPHKSKSKSPLGNELFSTSTKEAIVGSMESDLDHARQEIVQLRARIAEKEKESEGIEIKEMRIKALELNKQELEGRVRSLREQGSYSPSPKRTPDKSVMFRSIIGIATPKTPGQFASNISSWNSDTIGDTTIAPLLDEMRLMEETIDGLKLQLLLANNEADGNVDRLEQVGLDTISLARQLSTAQCRIHQLETELNRMIGEGGVLEGLVARLQCVNCPSCDDVIDVGAVLDLDVDSMMQAVNYAELKAAESTRPLLPTLSGFNAKAGAVRANDVNHGLEEDYEGARKEIAELRSQLEAERTRLDHISGQQNHAARAKLTLEARLAISDTELRRIKDGLEEAAVSPQSVERLSTERAMLAKERVELLGRLAAIHEDNAHLSDQLRTAQYSQTAMREQLDQQITEIHVLNESLAVRSNRDDLLRCVPLLQNDLQRVRSEVEVLGEDLARIKKERDEMSMKESSPERVEWIRVVEESEQASKRLLAAESALDQHVCPRNVKAIVERHSKESKGLLMRINDLRLRVTRQEGLSIDLMYQKKFMGILLKQHQIPLTSAIGSSHSHSPRHRQKLTFRTAVIAVISLTRMAMMSREARERDVNTKRLRLQAYSVARGYPFAAQIAP